METITQSPKSDPDTGVAERSEAEPVSPVQRNEVAAKPQRRRLTAAFKRDIVKKAEKCNGNGDIGALLRREGVYSSQLSEWRKLYSEGALRALADDKRGRKSKEANPLEKTVREQEREIRRLKKKLLQAEGIIDIQKKVAAILALGNDENDEGL